MLIPKSSRRGRMERDEFCREPIAAGPLRACEGGGPLQPRAAMEPVEVRLIRGVLGLKRGKGRPLSRAAFGSLLNRTDRQVYNYEEGRTPVPRGVAEKARRLLERATGRASTRGR